MSTDRAVWLIGRWMAVQPDMQLKMDDDEAGEADGEAVEGEEVEA